MNLISGLAIYFIVWWLTLFCVLPWRARSAYESGEAIEQGHAPSAPQKPRLLQKFAITTVISAIVFGLGYTAVYSGFITLDSIPFLPSFGEY